MKQQLMTPHQTFAYQHLSRVLIMCTIETAILVAAHGVQFGSKLVIGSKHDASLYLVDAIGDLATIGVVLQVWFQTFRRIRRILKYWRRLPTSSPDEKG